MQVSDIMTNYKWFPQMGGENYANGRRELCKW